MHAGGAAVRALVRDPYHLRQSGDCRLSISEWVVGRRLIWKWLSNTKAVEKHGVRVRSLVPDRWRFAWIERVKLVHPVCQRVTIDFFGQRGQCERMRRGVRSGSFFIFIFFFRRASVTYWYGRPVFRWVPLACPLACLRIRREGGSNLRAIVCSRLRFTSGRIGSVLFHRRRWLSPGDGWLKYD